MRLRLLIAAGWMVCCLAVASGWAQSPAVPATPEKQGTTAAQKQPAMAAGTEDKAGERKFQQNCNRCHNAPQDLQPRATGAVLLHMRVRASLSEDDEKAILRYMTQ